MQILGEMIPGPERENAQREGCSQEFFCHGVYSAVAAPGHNDLALFVDSPTRQLSDFGAAGC